MKYILATILILSFASVGWGEESKPSKHGLLMWGISYNDPKAIVGTSWSGIRDVIYYSDNGEELFKFYNTDYIDKLEQQLSAQGATIADLRLEVAELRAMVVELKDVPMIPLTGNWYDRCGCQAR